MFLDKWQLSDQEYGSESERMRWFMGQDLEGSSKLKDTLFAFGLTKLMLLLKKSSNASKETNRVGRKTL